MKNCFYKNSEIDLHINMDRWKDDYTLQIYDRELNM